MPLLPLPAHNTIRFRLNYSTGGSIRHSIICHQLPGTSQAQLITNATELANLLKPIMWTDSVFDSIDLADQGSDIFNQVAVISVAGSVAGGQPLYQRPYYYCYAGRGSSGRKTRLFQFGISVPQDPNWRVTGAENAGVQAIINGLNSNAGQIALIDGTRTGLLWKSYANLGTHDRYVKRIRRAG